MSTATSAGADAMTTSPYAGTRTLVRLAIRRDRVLIPVSVLALVLFAVGAAKSSLDLYPTPESLSKDVGALLSNPSITAMYGPISDPTSPDAFAVIKTVMLGAVLLGVLCYAVVRRHTRTEEEEGRLELIGAGKVGRRAPLTAAVLVALGAALPTVVLTGLGLTGLGMDAEGGLALGVAWLIAALFMTGTTAVAAQLTSTARGCTAIAMSVLGVAFLIRAVADSSTSSAVQAASWVSPLGWSTRVSAYGANRFWVLLLGLAFFAVTVRLAFALLERRDLGAGIMSACLGPARAHRSLGSPLALAWRLQRGGVLGWTIAYAILGVVLGSLAKSVAEATSGNAGIEEMLRTMGGSMGTLLDAFFATELKFAAVVATVAGITTVLRIRSEETSGHAESVLATATRRRSWLGAYVLLGLGVPAWLMSVAGLCAGVSSRNVEGAPSAGAVLGASLSTLPAVWLIVATAMALVGALPRWSAVAWAILGVAFVLGEFGSLVNLPKWLVDVSPYPHLPALPGGTMTWGSTVVMVVIAVVLGVATFVTFRRRDLTLS